MKFISVIALLAPAVLAADGEAWIALLKEKCSDMSEQCVDIAKKVHDPAYAGGQIPQAMSTCTPAYVECIQRLGDSDVPTFPQPGATQGQLSTCLKQISPDHIKYFLDNDLAETPIPASQNCALRELHRVAHVELGPLA